MNVLINMISLFQGGPKTVGFGLIEGLLNHLSSINYILMLPSGVGYENFIQSVNQTNANVKIVYIKYPHVRPRFMHKLFVDHILTLKFVNKFDADVLFMTANFPSLFSKVPQLVLQHNLFYLIKNSGSNESFTLKMERLLFWIGTKRDPTYLVQLNSVKELLCKHYKIPCASVKTVTMVPLILKNQYSEDLNDIKRMIDNKSINLIYPARYYKNKNHALLINLALYIKKTQINVKIFITIDDATASDYISLIKKHSLGETIINLGEISNEYMPDIYKKMDCLLYLSVIESFGFPLVEGLVSGLKLIVARSPYSEEVCGNAATYFNILDETTLIDAFERCIELFDDKQSQTNIKLQAFKYSHAWTDVVNHIENIIINLA